MSSPTQIVWREINAALTSGRPDATVYALLDGGQVYFSDLYGRYSYKRQRPIALFANDVDPDAALAGPILFEISEPKHHQFADELVALLFEKNAVSFFSSCTHIDFLAAHLRSLTEVVHDDGTEWIMRYFDPRILPHWIKALTPSQRNLALSPITRWSYMWEGGLATIDCGTGYSAISSSLTMQLTTQQHEYLMEQSTPYVVLNSMIEDDPSVFSGLNYSERTKKIFILVSQGLSYGLYTLTDLKTFCTLSMGAVHNFCDDVEVRRALLAGASGKFHTHVANWSNDVWERISNDVHNVLN